MKAHLSLMHSKMRKDQLQQWVSYHGSLEIATWSDTMQQDLDYALEYRLNCLSWIDPEYPQKLLNYRDYPHFLMIQGTLLPRDHQAVAIVGTREPSPESLKKAYQLAFDLASQGYTIISGLARGIDTAAHWGAIHAGGRTLAVLGSGLAVLYPAENKSLANSIAKQGALISEYTPFTKPERYHFPQRNRIVSGLSRGVILVEAGLNSGAMQTMLGAQKQGIPLFVCNNKAEGNQQLIKHRKATLVNNAQDVFVQLKNRTPKQLCFDWSYLGCERIGVS